MTVGPVLAVSGEKVLACARQLRQVLGVGAPPRAGHADLLPGLRGVGTAAVAAAHGRRHLASLVGDAEQGAHRGVKEVLPLPDEAHVPPNSTSSNVSAPRTTTAGASGATVTAGSVRAWVVNCPSPTRGYWEG